jgi:hypothetical protein
MANLTDLLNHINFTKEEINTVDGAMVNLINTIKVKANDNKIPKPISYFMFGSIARKTKIKPLDDVDIMYVVGTAIKQGESENHTLSECSIKFGEEKCEPNTNNISSLILLNDIKAAIKESYSKSEVRRNQEVVNVYLASYGVGFDIVPAFIITNMDYYLIPRGHGFHNWKKTNPAKGMELFNRVNNRHKYLVRDTLKIIKYWFQKKNIVTPGSYHLECVLCYAFDNSILVLDNLKSTLTYAFQNINFNNYLLSCPDPYGPAGDLKSDLIQSDADKIVAYAKEAEKLLSNIPEFVNYVDEDIV